MIQSRNWTAIERLPEAPGVVKMTGNGYWLDGCFYPAHEKSQPILPMEQPSFWERLRRRGGGR